LTGASVSAFRNGRRNRGAAEVHSRLLYRRPRLDTEALTPIVEFMGKKPIPVEAIADNSIVNRLGRDGFIDKLYSTRLPFNRGSGFYF
jgi:hypothetical protein